MPKKLNIAIIFGGKSGEHEVSVKSASSIFKALDKKKYNVTKIKVRKNGRWEKSPLTLKTFDVVFPIIHGTYGEDGKLQGLLEMMNVAYVGPGVLGSAVGMDKDVMKRLLKEAKIPVAEFVVIPRIQLSKRTLRNAVKNLKYPIFAKPANMGSSVGISKAKNFKGLQTAVRRAFQYDTKILLEKTVKGREIECAVFGNEYPHASVPGEIIPTHEFYSYEAKYLDENGAALAIPAKLSKTQVKQIRNLAIQVFQTLQCEGMGRVDFFLTPAGKIIVNEINTLPGFTSVSMYPKLWEASGLPYSKLLDRLIQLAIERKKKDRKLKRSFQ